MIDAFDGYLLFDQFDTAVLCPALFSIVGHDPAQMWEFYTQLVHVEEAFKNLKGDLAIRPIHHQKEERIEAHIFLAFMAYTLHVTLRRPLRDLAPRLTPRSVLE
jgi:transposase